jgi:uncharacterized protein YggU (UPF0235/DUF167 family)
MSRPAAFDMTTRVVVFVVPGAKGPGVVGRHGDGWKVRVAAPAERGRANEALLGLLAASCANPLGLGKGRGPGPTPGSSP